MHITHMRFIRVRFRHASQQCPTGLAVIKRAQTPFPDRKKGIGILRWPHNLTLRICWSADLPLSQHTSLAGYQLDQLFFACPLIFFNLTLARSCVEVALSYPPVDHHHHHATFQRGGLGGQQRSCVARAGNKNKQTSSLSPYTTLCTGRSNSGSYQTYTNLNLNLNRPHPRPHTRHPSP
jgi:hypothetical protein